MSKDRARAPQPDIVPFSGINLHLETDQIAVWEEHFQPGVSTDAHRHTRDYVAIALTDIDLTVEPVAGQTSEVLTVLVPQPGMMFDGNRGRLPKGVVFCSQVSATGAAHVAFNNSTEVSKILIIELKGTGMEASSQP